MHSSDHMFQCLWIKFILHLCNLCPLRHRTYSIWSNKASGIILKSKKIIILYIGKIMCKFLLPLMLCSCISTINSLNIMK